jgi:predicted dehydrogenase
MIKFAVLGTGHIGKRHIDIIKEKATLVDASSDIDTLLEKDFDVLNICTPNGLHAQHAIKALQAGKHVVIEKPMSLSSQASQEIIQASIKADKKVFCVMQNRYSAPNRWLKENLHRLGDIYMVQANCYWNRNDEYYNQSAWRGTNDLDGGTLYTQFSHFIDILYYLFGDISNVQARFRNFNHDIFFEDSGIVQFDLNNGIGSLNYSTCAYEQNMESSLTILAEKASIQIGGQYMNKVDYACGIDIPVFDIVDQNDYGTWKGSANNHNQVIDNVIHSLERGSKPDVTMLDGLRVVEIINKIYELR